MQRWIVGAGVVVVALVGAVLFFPSTDTGGQVAERSRKEIAVEPLKKADPVELKRARDRIDARKNHLNRAGEAHEKRLYEGKMNARNLASSERYRLQLADRGLTRRNTWKAWASLDDALDGTDTREAMEFRRHLVELQKMSHAAFDDPSRFKELLAQQQKILVSLEASPVARDPNVSKALEASLKSHKQLAEDISKL